MSSRTEKNPNTVPRLNSVPSGPVKAMIPAPMSPRSAPMTKNGMTFGARRIVTLRRSGSELMS